MAESAPVADIEPSNPDIAGSQTPAAGKKKNKKQKSPKSAPNQSQEGTSNPDPPTTQQMESEANPTAGGDQAQGKSKKDKGQGQGQKPPADPNAPQKSKAQLKAERRAIQEAQRAAKASGKKDGATSKGATQAQGGKKEYRIPDNIQADDEHTQKKLARNLEKQRLPQRTVVQKKVGLFSHLHQYEREVSLTQGIQVGNGTIHPAILRLGLQYAEGVICGSNARCFALLTALKQVIADYTTPPQKELSRDLEARIKPYISFLKQCRPLSVSMGNAIKYLKFHITKIPEKMSDSEAKQRLYDCINSFLKEILLAGEAISKSYASTKIQNGDVILVYACSSLIRKVLCDAFDMGKKFRVIIVDGRPKMEGREMLQRLSRHGIKCSYILINAASYVMQEVTKVFLGSHALLANGYVMSRVGSSQIALIAKAYNVPVLVCCETYKFCDRVQTDSFVFNELGDPDDLVQIDRKVTYLSDWRDMRSLTLLNLMYDVTPPELITLVITEIGMIPCTSVPVVLRVKHAETSQG